MRTIMNEYFQALHITASTRLRFASPKLAPDGRQLRVLAKRCMPC